LGVGCAKDVHAHQVDSNDSDQLPQSQNSRKEYQIPGLQGVSERHPTQISKGKHESKSFSGQIGSGQDLFLKKNGGIGKGIFVSFCLCLYLKSKSNLIEQAIPHVDRVKDTHQDHGVVHSSLQLVLLVGHAQVDQHPPNQSRPQLTKVLPVKPKGAGVLGAAHPKIVHHHT